VNGLPSDSALGRSRSEWSWEREMLTRNVELLAYWLPMVVGPLVGPKAARQLKPAPAMYVHPNRGGDKRREITTDPGQIRGFFERLRG